MASTKDPVGLVGCTETSADRFSDTPRNPYAYQQGVLLVLADQIAEAGETVPAGLMQDAEARIQAVEGDLKQARAGR